MDDQNFQVAVGDNRSITAVVSRPLTPRPRWLFIYAPGAGSNVNDPFGTYASQQLPDHGIAVARFQFPYMEARTRRPDTPTILEATWRQIIEHLRSECPKIAVGGRSMGGRIASQVVAKGVNVDALALLAYPLHPPGNPGRIRDAHFPNINVPTQFCSGTRDTFATPDELMEASTKVSRAKVHILEGADHGFAVLKSSGQTRQDVWDAVISGLVSFVSELDDPGNAMDPESGVL